MEGYQGGPQHLGANLSWVVGGARGSHGVSVWGSWLKGRRMGSRHYLRVRWQRRCKGPWLRSWRALLVRELYAAGLLMAFPRIQE